MIYIVCCQKHDDQKKKKVQYDINRFGIKEIFQQPSIGFVEKIAENPSQQSQAEQHH